LKPFPTITIKYSLSEIVRGFKTFSSRRINEIVGKIMFHWQKSFYDHIIGNEKSLWAIRQYIRDNPLNWEEDRNNPENLFM
jgi:REP element-mobilizing transposase RayT